MKSSNDVDVNIEEYLCTGYDWAFSPVPCLFITSATFHSSHEQRKESHTNTLFMNRQPNAKRSDYNNKNVVSEPFYFLYNYPYYLLPFLLFEWICLFCHAANRISLLNGFWLGVMRYPWNCADSRTFAFGVFSSEANQNSENFQSFEETIKTIVPNAKTVLKPLHDKWAMSMLLLPSHEMNTNRKRAWIE